MYSRVWFSRGCDCSINVHCCNDISVCREENDRIVCIKPVTILLTNFLCDTSYLTHLVPISWEQYLTIKHPLASNTGLVTEAHLLITSASAWFFSRVLQMPLSIHPQVAFGFKNTFIVLSPVTIIFCHFTVHRGSTTSKRNFTTSGSRGKAENSTEQEISTTNSYRRSGPFPLLYTSIPL